MRRIDGTACLAAELDRLSATNPVAFAAPRGTGIARYLTEGLSTEAAASNGDGPFWRLTLHLLQRLSLWWSPDG